MSTALSNATAEGNSEVVRILLSHGANPDYRGNRIVPPIHAAIFTRRQDLLELLCSNEANVEIRDNRDFTPLITAVLERNVSAVQFLLNYGKLFLPAIFQLTNSCLACTQCFDT